MGWLAMKLAIIAARGSNMNFREIAATAALGLALGVSAQANAVVVTDHFNIETSGYSDLSGSAAAPFDPLDVAFDVTFDPTQANSGVAVTFTNPLPSTFTGINLRFTNSIGPATFNLEGNDSAGDYLNFQYVFNTPTIIPGVFAFTTGVNDFGAYTLNNFTDLFIAEPGVSSSGAGQVTIKAAVPEPAS
ncbi:MAG TPA: hypothetical protein VHY56_08050, partial [Candidatus Binataceae bacterium]|nr:hypothetical protein [Candidatus Binataceae bacterium]